MMLEKNLNQNSKTILKIKMKKTDIKKLIQKENKSHLRTKRANEIVN